MSRKKEKRREYVENALETLGIDRDTTAKLLRISGTLHRWGELECGSDRGCIERDEKTGKPYMRCYTYTGEMLKPFRVPDREAGALKRLQKIMDQHPALAAYHQTDPRGCALYILRRDQVLPGEKLDCVYSRGVAVCTD